MNEQQALSILKEPNGSEKLTEEAFRPALSLLAQEEPAAAAFLTRLARQKKYRQAINEWLGDRSLLYRLLGSGDAKLRKNTARLMGQLLVPEDAAPLAEALAQESRRLVIPSMILALGALKTPEARKALEAYQVEPAQDASEEKHVRAEEEALRTALGNWLEMPSHRFEKLPPKVPMELRCAKGLEQELARELEGLPVRAVHPGYVSLTVNQWEELSRSRIWREALIPLCRSAGSDGDWKAAANTVRRRMLTILQTAYGPGAPYTFRVELAGRPEQAKAFAHALEQQDGQLVNAPSHYEAEVRVEDRGMYLRLCLAPDQRFAYRKAAVPASIHPANAAGVIRLAAPYLTEGARVLDPCCGSGTLLIERAMQGPCRMLTGVDIQKHALQAALQNGKAAGLSGYRLIHSDCLQYQPRELADELFANLPFGNRVGNHAENLKLYRGLTERLPRWVRPGGTAVLYTMEGKLLEQCLYSQRRLRILRRCRVEAGGLEPKVFIVTIL